MLPPVPQRWTLLLLLILLLSYIFVVSYYKSYQCSINFNIGIETKRETIAETRRLQKQDYKTLTGLLIISPERRVALGRGP